VFVGPVASPHVTKRGDHSFEVAGTAASGNAMALRLRGNEGLLKELSSKTAWNQLLELLK
jgi:hypothetical protein